MLDDINEQNDQMAQIQDAMAQPIGGAADMDDDELMLELEVRFTRACFYKTESARCVAPLLPSGHST